MIEAREAIQLRPASRLAAWRRYLPFVLALTDVALIFGAFVLAYWIRYSLEVGPRIQFHVDFVAYLPQAAVLTVIALASLFLRGAYRSRIWSDAVDEIGSILSATTLAVAGIVVITAMLHQDQYSRAVVLYVWVLVVGLLAAGRILRRAVQGYCHRRGWGTVQVLIVGGTDAAMMAMQNMVSRPDLGYRLAGFVDHRSAPVVRDFGRFRALGTLLDVPDLLSGREIDEVIIALPSAAHEDVWPILSLCEREGVGLKLIPDLFEMSLSRVQVDDIGGIPLLDVREQPLRRVARLAKRIIDALVGGLLLVASLPLLLLLAVMVRLGTPGPAFLAQDRIGQGGRRFTCYKLRSMRRDADEIRPALAPLNEIEGPMFKMRDDPRMTRIGRWMRRWSLDEIPQLVNVVRGDMSLVGPRPPLPAEAAQYDDRQRRRLEVKPGLTGIWQVSGRSDLSFDEMVLMDIYYVDNWSMALDLRILLRTVSAVLRRHGAY